MRAQVSHVPNGVAPSGRRWPLARPGKRHKAQRTIRPGTGLLTDTYTYPTTNNQLQSIALGAGGTRSFTYDAAGNVTYDNRSGQGFGYTYDNAGRMASFSLSGVVQAEYRYNQLGQQITRRLTQTAVTIHSVYGPDGNRIAEYNEATGALIRQYIWLEGAPIAVVEGGVISFVRSDHIGRPVFATDSSGVKTWTAAYLPFGGVRVSTGTPPTARFPGQWFQSETGLHQNWMRDYDPTTGRYMQADPLGLVDGASVYGYARQSPGRYVDPRGETRLLLQYGGIIIDQDWVRDPSLPEAVGMRWNQKCSKAQLVYHNSTRTDTAHWHYYPYGQERGGRLADLGRWYDRFNQDHLYPPYVIELPECPCDGSQADASAVTGAALLLLFLLQPEVGAIAGAGAVAAQ